MGLICLMLGHHWQDAKCVDHVPERGTAVLARRCWRCDREELCEIPGEWLIGENRPEGPWDTEPCVICREPVMRSGTVAPELWPATAVCRSCRELWEMN